MQNPHAAHWMGNAALAALALACTGAHGETPAWSLALAGRGPSGPKPARVVTEVPASRAANHPPRFLSTAPRTAREGSSYVYDPAVVDPDGDQVAFSLLRAPDGAVLEGEVLKWTPTHAQAGHRQRFTLRAVDEHGAARVQHWSVIPGKGRDKGVLGGRRTRH
jgi:hypothetical protein